MAKRPRTTAIPEPDETVDLVVSNSLLTHVLEAELENYIRESYRLLKPGGAIMHSHFNLDYPPASYGTRHTFQHTIGNARVELLGAAGSGGCLPHRFPVPVAREAGFKDCEIVYMPGGAQHQPILLCKK